LKLSKTSWLFLAIGIFIIALVGLGAVRSNQVARQNQLDQELTQAQLRLKGFQIEQLSQRKRELERQLNQTLAKFEADRAVLSPPIDSIAISRTLFDIATTHHAEIVEINSPGLASVNLEGVRSSALAVNVRVKGDLPALVDFVADVNNSFKTGVFKSIEINVPEATSGEKASANIQLYLYAYQGN